jgi:hypothetical protein
VSHFRPLSRLCPTVSRFTGMAVFILLVGLCVALRFRAENRAERLLANESLAGQQVVELGLALEARMAAGQEGATLLDVLEQMPRLEPLDAPRTETANYARDAIYAYGLGLTQEPDAPSGARRAGWVLRAWPLEFGRTGDIEFHLDDRGTFWKGQNEVGRSGTERGFPPPYPQPGITQRGQPWWPADIAKRRAAHAPKDHK